MVPLKKAMVGDSSYHVFAAVWPQFLMHAAIRHVR